jgi:aminomuconate-semialdehyde/2-hydroxymuconate-6-semialdehyde dehydrogenase
VSLPSIDNFIGGKVQPPVRGEYIDNVEPATGAVYSCVADSSEEDVESAVAAARAAFPAWSGAAAAERSATLLRLADLLESQLERFARAESIDNGKPISLSRSLDIPRAVSNLRFFATAILHSQSECHPTDSVALNYTLREPRGVCGLISPWNLPLYLFTWKVAPAMAYGNTAVAKPSEITPMTAFMFGELCNEARLPPGVLNIVHGRGSAAGDAIVRHPGVRTISFTGGTVTGATIARTAGPMFKKLALELGGKNPNIVFADADLDVCVGESVRAAFSNQGQVCLAGSRLYVEQSIFDEFLRRFVARASALRVGDPLEESTEIAAVVSKAHRDKVIGYVEAARAEGGVIHCGGGAPQQLPGRCRNGFYVGPTVISGLPVSSKVNCEEIFGPVVTVTPFASEDEAVGWANATSYGLSASVWTRDLDRAHRVARRLAAGTVWVNCWLLRDLRVPFGGTKNSGVGREGGLEAMRFFTEPKNVCVRTR